MRIPVLSLVLLLLACTTNNKKLTLSSVASPAGDQSFLPRLYTDNTGSVFLSWVEQSDDEYILYYSKLDEESWSKPVEISRSDSWFINWADFPSVIAYNGKALAAHWLQKIPGNTYSYNVEVSSAALNWDSSITPHNDNTATEHGFVSMAPMSDSTFLSIWLDGRNTGGGHGGPGNLDHAMTLRSAVLSTNLELLSGAEVDASVCDCCGTSVAKTPDGYLVAYRNRTKEEIRDIYFAEYQNGAWTEPQAVHNDNWQIAACPVNGPALSSGTTKTAVAWFTAANDTAKVKLSFKPHGAPSFEAPITVHDYVPLGRVDVEILDDNNTLVSWLERDPEDSGKAVFKAKHYDSENNLLHSYKLSELKASRSTGFPQITRYKSGFVTAWTHIDEKGTKTVRIAILD